MDALGYNYALQLSKPGFGDQDQHSFARVQYYTIAKSEEGKKTYTWVNTTRCDTLIEKYGSAELKEHINGDSLGRFLIEEFETTDYGDGWLCPDVTTF